MTLTETTSYAVLQEATGITVRWRYPLDQYWTWTAHKESQSPGAPAKTIITSGTRPVEYPDAEQAQEHAKRWQLAAGIARALDGMYVTCSAFDVPLRIHITQGRDLEAFVTGFKAHNDTGFVLVVPELKSV